MPSACLARIACARRSLTSTCHDCARSRAQSILVKKACRTRNLPNVLNQQRCRCLRHHELRASMLRGVSWVVKRPVVVSPRVCRQRLRTMAGFSKSENHPKNYVFGDSLERDQELPHSKSPALEFQVRAVAGRARAAQMQLPHFLCETPMFMPVGTQGVITTYVSAVCPVHQAPP